MTLFENKPFVSHSGVRLPFKINCDALRDKDIATIATIVHRRFAFSKVHPIPRGGTRLAKALEQFCVPGAGTIIVDDVFTTGASMKKAWHEIGHDSIGVVIYARNRCPSWVYPVFRLAEWAQP